jgi:hypothetical protein
MGEHSGNKSKKTSRWERLRNLDVSFPEPEKPTLPAPVSRQPVQINDTAMETYPLLRVWLRDRNLQFKPVFGQRDVAEVIDKCDKTVRARTRKGQIPCHRWPWGEVYYTPQDIEDLLAGSEPTQKGAK